MYMMMMVLYLVDMVLGNELDFGRVYMELWEWDDGWDWK